MKQVYRSQSSEKSSSSISSDPVGEKVDAIVVAVKPSTAHFAKIAKEVKLLQLASDSEVNEIEKFRESNPLDCGLYTDIFLDLVHDPTGYNGDSATTIATKMLQRNASADTLLFGSLAMTMCATSGYATRSGTTEQNRSHAFVKAMSTMGMVESLLKMVQNQSVCDRTLYFALNALSCFGLVSEKVALKMVNAGGIDIAIDIIKGRLSSLFVTCDDIAIVTIAATFLTFIATKSRSIRFELIRKDCPSLVEELLDDKRITNRECLNLLKNMLEQPKFWWGTVLSAAMFLAREHRE
jgi:hypothetical protein